jgi:hypothetical protein
MWPSWSTTFLQAGVTLLVLNRLADAVTHHLALPVGHHDAQQGSLHTAGYGQAAIRQVWLDKPRVCLSAQYQVLGPSAPILNLL